MFVHVLGEKHMHTAGKAICVGFECTRGGDHALL